MARSHDGLWCNGNTVEFDSTIRGSSPRSPATRVLNVSPLASGKLIYSRPMDKNTKTKGQTAFSRKVWLADRLYGNWGFHILYRKEWGTVSTKAACFVTF